MELLTGRQVAARLGVSVLTLRKWRWERRGTDLHQAGQRAVRYPIDSLSAYLAACKKGDAEVQV